MMLAQVDYNKNYIYIKYPESVSPETIYGVLDALDKIDTSLNQISNRLHDFQASEKNLFGPDLLEKIVQRRIASKEFKGVKTALVIKNKLQFEIARRIDGILENTGMRTAIFYSLDQAIEYLTQ